MSRVSVRGVGGHPGGHAVFHLSDEGTELEFKLIVANIRNQRSRPTRKRRGAPSDAPRPTAAIAGCYASCCRRAGCRRRASRRRSCWSGANGARLHKTLVDQRSTWVQRIHAELFQHGVTLPEPSIRWARTRELLDDDSLEISPAGRQRVLTAYR